MAVFVPPAILHEVQAIFHLPMPANIGVKLGGRDAARVEAGHEIPAFLEENRTGRRTDFPLRTEEDFALRNVQTLAQILGIAQVEPQSAGFAAAPLFSVMTWAGRSGNAAAKQVRRASSMSGWLALT